MIPNKRLVVVSSSSHFTVFFLLLHYLIFFSKSIPTVNSQINVWPKPRILSWPYPQANLLSPSFKIISPYHHKHLTPAIQRYHNLIHSEHYNPIIIQHPNVINIATASSSHPPLEILTLTITDLNSPLQHGVDESYDLTIPTVGSANLTSKTVWGAMRGLETFSQLVWSGGGDSLLFVGTGLYISDWAIFGHRGVLLDTSRNYYGVDDIIRTIKAMSANKLNVFHWHITDSHSFPLVLPSEPELARKGSYGPKMMYSVADVRKIVEVGFQHGVRVLPEIDMPGHTGSWAEAYPEIVTCANMFWQPVGTAWEDRLASEPGTGQLNPLNPKTYEVTHNVLKDIATLFPEDFFHGGADEVVSGCWKTDPMVQNFVSNGGTFSQLLEIFINSTLPYITSLNHTNVVYWEDVLLDQYVKVDPSFLPKDSVILQTWNNGPNNTKLIVSAGYRAIVSSSDFYYLDCGHGGFVGNDSRYDKQNGDDLGSPFNYNNGNGGSWCSPFKTWQRIYDYDITHGLTEDEAKFVLGGEVALWSEQADPSVLDARIWPRASAMAETLWSGNRDETGKKRYAEATNRLNEWRYRMVARGIGAEPIQPLWCMTHPGMCNMAQ
ncbi:beta-hexosaminidase 2-like [Papaver somniferum]|uniref:beta-hexosaminidase 2-like n=1 Tax=Papaver somniferum TaxID=3469 RepID=UPI000E6F56A1|nr:beta-hexosaminidase 2-like [Papaver somniferum]